MQSPPSNIAKSPDSKKKKNKNKNRRRHVTFDKTPEKQTDKPAHAASASVIPPSITRSSKFGDNLYRALFVEYSSASNPGKIHIRDAVYDMYQLICGTLDPVPWDMFVKCLSASNLNLRENFNEISIASQPIISVDIWIDFFIKQIMELFAMVDKDNDKLASSDDLMEVSRIIHPNFTEDRHLLFVEDVDGDGFDLLDQSKFIVVIVVECLTHLTSDFTPIINVIFSTNSKPKINVALENPNVIDLPPISSALLSTESVESAGNDLSTVRWNIAEGKMQLSNLRAEIQIASLDLEKIYIEMDRAKSGSAASPTKNQLAELSLKLEMEQASLAITLREIESWKIKYHDSQQELVKLKQEHVQIKELESHLKAALVAFDEERKTLSDERSKLDEDYNKILLARQEIKNVKNQLEEERNQIRQNMQLEMEQISHEKNLREIESWKLKYHESQQDLVKLQHEHVQIKELESRLMDSLAALDEVRKTLNEERSKLDEDYDKIEFARQELYELEKNVEEDRNQIRADMMRIQQESEGLERERQDLGNKRAAAARYLAEREAEISEEKKSIEKKLNDLESYKNHLEEEAFLLHNNSVDKVIPVTPSLGESFDNSEYSNAQMDWDVSQIRSAHSLLREEASLIEQERMSLNILRQQISDDNEITRAELNHMSENLYSERTKLSNDVEVMRQDLRQLEEQLQNEIYRERMAIQEEQRILSQQRLQWEQHCAGREKEFRQREAEWSGRLLHDDLRASVFMKIIENKTLRDCLSPDNASISTNTSTSTSVSMNIDSPLQQNSHTMYLTPTLLLKVSNETGEGNLHQLKSLRIRPVSTYAPINFGSASSSDSPVLPVENEIEAMSKLRHLENLHLVPRLQSLDVSGHALTSVSTIDSCIYLTNLNVSFNQLTSLPRSLSKCSQLQHLNLSGNQLNRIPQVLSSLSVLQTLRLNDNQLEKLSDLSRLRSLRQLYSLSLAGNPFTNIPHWQMLVSYYVRSIDMLDGHSIDPVSRANAISRFSEEEIDVLRETVKIAYDEAIKLKGECDQRDDRINNLNAEVEHLKYNLQTLNDALNKYVEKLSVTENLLATKDSELGKSMMTIIELQQRQSYNNVYPIAADTLTDAPLKPIAFDDVMAEMDDLPIRNVEQDNQPIIFKESFENVNSDLLSLVTVIEDKDKIISSLCTKLNRLQQENSILRAGRSIPPSPDKVNNTDTTQRDLLEEIHKLRINYDDELKRRKIVEDDYKQLKNEFSESIKRETTATDFISSLEHDLETLHESHIQSEYQSANRYSDLQEQLFQQSCECDNIRNELVHVTKQMKILRIEKLELQKDLDVNVARINNLNEQSSLLDPGIHSLRKEFRKLEQKHQAIAAKFSDLFRQYKDLKSQVIDFNDVGNTVFRNFNDLKCVIEEIKFQITTWIQDNDGNKKYSQSICSSSETKFDDMNLVVQNIKDELVVSMNKAALLENSLALQSQNVPLDDSAVNVILLIKLICEVVTSLFIDDGNCVDSAQSLFNQVENLLFCKSGSVSDSVSCLSLLYVPISHSFNSVLTCQNQRYRIILELLPMFQAQNRTICDVSFALSELNESVSKVVLSVINTGELVSKHLTTLNEFSYIMQKFQRELVSLSEMSNVAIVNDISMQLKSDIDALVLAKEEEREELRLLYIQKEQVTAELSNDSQKLDDLRGTLTSLRKEWNRQIVEWENVIEHNELSQVHRIDNKLKDAEHELRIMQIEATNTIRGLENEIDNLGHHVKDIRGGMPNSHDLLNEDLERCKNRIFVLESDVVEKDAEIHKLLCEKEDKYRQLIETGTTTACRGCLFVSMESARLNADFCRFQQQKQREIDNIIKGYTNREQIFIKQLQECREKLLKIGSLYLDNVESVQDISKKLVRFAEIEYDQKCLQEVLSVLSKVAQSQALIIESERRVIHDSTVIDEENNKIRTATIIAEKQRLEAECSILRKRSEGDRALLDTLVRSMPIADRNEDPKSFIMELVLKQQVIRKLKDDLAKVAEEVKQLRKVCKSSLEIDDLDDGIINFLNDGVDAKDMKSKKKNRFYAVGLGIEKHGKIHF